MSIPLPVIREDFAGRSHVDDHIAIHTVFNSTINILKYGAIGDGITDNSAVFALVSAIVNALGSTTTVQTIDFPDGYYVYSSGLAFDYPVILKGSGGAILDYQGSSKAIRLGADGLTISNYHYYPYTVQGLILTGGASMSHGIYFNKFVTVCRLQEVFCVNFGNASTAGIWFHDENWDALMLNCSYYSNSATAKNWVRVNAAGGINSTRLRCIECLGTQQGAGQGYGIWLDGANNSILSSKIEGFLPNVHVGSLAQHSRIQGSYFESTNNSGCIRYGDLVDGRYPGTYCADLVITSCYANMHNDDFGYSDVFLFPGSVNTGLQDCRLESNTFVGLNPTTPVVRLNTGKFSQYGNCAIDNNGYTLLSDSAPYSYWAGQTEGLSRGALQPPAIHSGNLPSAVGHYGARVYTLDTNLALISDGTIWRQEFLKSLGSKTVGTGQSTIAHGLGYTPTQVVITMTSAGNIYRSATSDATNIYLTADSAGRTADIYVR